MLAPNQWWGSGSSLRVLDSPGPDCQAATEDNPIDPAILDDIDRVVGFLQQSSRLLFITGAGISADSGLPTYRGVGGLYDIDDTEEGMPIEQLLSGGMMAQRPELTWKYLAQIGMACRGAVANRGHEVIAEMDEHFDHVCTLTQNVDGFHRQAGSRCVIEIHGDLHDLVCTGCDFQQRIDEQEFDELAIPPICPRCRSVLRPDVVLFGEMLSSAKIGQLQHELAVGFDVMFAVGTTAVFPYISEPIRIARQLGCQTVEINPGTSEVSDLVDVHIQQRAAFTLDLIWQRYGEKQV